MGANPTQAQAVVLFLAAFICISAGLAADINFLFIVVGVALLAGSTALFVKCKPWEHKES
jgi:hypothetical protein